MFAYTEDEAYVMMAFNVIKTDRIDNLFLTGLLNSRLVQILAAARGKMQGNNIFSSTRSRSWRSRSARRPRRSRSASRRWSAA